MIDDDLERGWRQHFPTYAFKERDVALEEYKTAAKNLESEERVFLNASNIAVIVAAGIGSLAVGTLDKLSNQFKSIIPTYVTMGVLLSLIMGLSVVSLLYFADRQKALVFAARKVIVLRRMMGLSYGTIQLILPNWRVEGADEPFAIRLFPGWLTYVTYPYFALAGISSAVIFFLLACLAPEIRIFKDFTVTPMWVLILTTSVTWAFFLAYTYRRALLDVHEHQMLLFTQNLAKLLKFRIVTNFEYVIYRATLAHYEMNRLKIKTNTLRTFLIFIEDRSFYKHGGVSLRALLRAFLGLVKIKRRSGGSTITQQLVRTLFIHDQSKLVRRKTIEILLAICFNKIFNKNEQIDLYLASVRFERGVYGVMEAMHYFWDQIVEKPSKAQSFFLIERVSNINSKILADKIVQTAKNAETSGLFTKADLNELLKLYQDAVTNGKVKDPEDKMAMLSNSLTL